MINIQQSRIKVGAWTICIGFALLQLWSGRNYTDPDGISYLDMSDALLKHNWHMLVNPYWSPLYPFLIGIARGLIHPSAYWELPVVHLVNFAIFLVALAAFEFFLVQALPPNTPIDELQDREPMFLLPPSLWTLLGYSLFAWSALVLAKGIRGVFPDLLVAAFIYLDAGLLLRIRAGAKQLPKFLLLGLSLGLGYYAKAAMFPIAFVLMAVAFFMVGEWRKAVRYSLVMALVFGAVAAPLVMVTSKTAGHPTFGDSGSNNYARLVAGEKTFPFYSTTPPPYLIHPLNRIHHDPNVFEFGHPFIATYPLWYDVSYWDAGFKTRFNLTDQLRVIVQSAKRFFGILIKPMAGPITCYLILLILSRSLSGCMRRTLRGWPLIVPGVVGICMYSLVLLEPRYIAAFAVLIWIGLLSGIRIPKNHDSLRFAQITMLAFAGWLTVMVAGLSVYYLARPLPILQGHGGRYYQVAEILNADGLLPGQAVAVVGPAFDGMTWARLARLRIVAQIPPEDVDDFWRVSDPRVETEIYSALASAGVMAVVSQKAPSFGRLADWQKIGDTQYYVHFLSPPGSR